ncbi:MAG: hypothetical protein ACUVWO_07320 [Thermodesulfobacteriota bacterium]
MKPADSTRKVQEFKNAAADALLSALYVEQARKTMGAKGKLDWRNVTSISTGPLTDDQPLNVPGGYGEGTIGLCLYPDPETSQEPGVLEYREKMKKDYPSKPPNRYS